MYKNYLFFSEVYWQYVLPIQLGKLVGKLLKEKTLFCYDSI